MIQRNAIIVEEVESGSYLLPNDELKINFEINQVVIIDEQKIWRTLNLLSLSFHVDSCRCLPFCCSCCIWDSAETKHEGKSHRMFLKLCDEQPEKNQSNVLKTDLTPIPKSLLIPFS